MSWLFGITWLAIPFGAYFGLKLVRAGDGPLRPWPALAGAAAGVVVVLVGLRLARRVPLPFPPILIVIWLVMALGAALAWVGWPALGRTLLLYGLAARIPVALVMLVAIYANWGTHYDVPPPNFPEMAPLPKWFMIGFLPQMFMWIPFTIYLGTLFGGLALLAAGRRREPAVASAPGMA